MSVLRGDHCAGVIGPEFRWITFRQSVHQLLMKVVVAGGYGWGDAFVIHLPGAIDVVAQVVIDVALRSAIPNLLLVVELDLGNQQARKAARIIVKPPFIFVYFDRQICVRTSPSSRRAKRSSILSGHRTKRFR